MKRLYIALLLSTTCLINAMAQATLQTSDAITGFSAIPQETTYVHYNAPLLLTGEYLYYKLYCLDTQTKQATSISKIGYVELIGSDLKTVFKHKLLLKDGVGAGDFFVPPSLPSGNYKLLGYTQWMTNSAKKNFFQQDISLINPYVENQSAILAPKVASSQTINDLENTMPPVPSETKSSLVALELSSKQYGTRNLVSASLSSLINENGYGNYSISVRKVDEISGIPNRIQAAFDGAVNAENGKNKPNIGTLIALPELRGELISGKVMRNGSPVPNKEIAFSIPGGNYLFEIAETDASGTFYINLDNTYDQTHAYAQVLDPEAASYEVLFFQAPSVATKTLDFYQFTLQKSDQEKLLKRSIYNQVENGYFTVKTDSVLPAPMVERFYGKPSVSYNLDDYTRFPTIRETLLEVIDNAWVKNVGDGKSIFQVRAQDNSFDINALPLVLVDGVYIQDHNDFVDYNARKVQRVHILKDQYYFGSKVYQGVLDFETIKNDYENLVYKDYVKKVELFKPQPQKDYYKPIYTLDNEDKTKRIPDFRNQLLWMPNVRMHTSEVAFTFYTSDNVGTYVVEVEGFTDSGTPVSISESFVVKE